MAGFHLPRYGEIPDVGLFLEQTVRLINGYLEPLGGFELTNSMVSNYVKQKLIGPPVRKEYHRGQIAGLTFIAISKSVLSLEDIRRCFALQSENYSTEAAYDYFCAEFENVLQYVFSCKEALSDVGSSRSDAKELLRNMIFAVAHKIHLMKYLETLCDSQPPAN